MLPWLGSAFGWTVAKLLRQPTKDCIAISIEVGFQNQTFAIILLSFALEQPLADIGAAVPLYVTIVTISTLVAFYIVKVIIMRYGKTKSESLDDSPDALNETK